MSSTVTSRLFYLAHPFLLILIFLFSLFRQGPLYGIPLPYTRWGLYGLGLAGVTGFLYYLFTQVFRGKYPASVATSLVLINFLFFKNLVELIRFTRPETAFNKFADNYFDAGATACILVANVVLLAILFYAKKAIKPIAGYLTLLTAGILVSSVGQAALELYQKKEVALMNPEVQTAKPIRRNPLPDIYYFISDAYTSNESLKKYFNYDNKEFTGYLKHNGFFIADQAKANYNITIASLSSSLNGSYLGIDDKTKFSPHDLRRMSNWVNHNFVLQQLKKQGYAIYNYSFLDFNSHRNNQYAFDPNPGFRSFIDYTLLAPVSSYIKAKSKETHRVRLQETDKFYTYNRYSLDFIYKHKEIVHDTRPAFFYIHTLVTHPPFVFSPTGEKLLDEHQQNNPAQYPKQVAYVNTQLQAIIKYILTESAKPSIIIIQGDHGSHLKGLAESQTIFSAYYFPDKNYSQLYRSISPVNTFRVILNTYFNTDLPLLPDKHYQVYYGPK